MRVLIRSESAQVVDGRGRLVRAFPNGAQAEAYVQGYAEGQRDAAAAVRAVVADTLAGMESETRGMGATG